MTSPISPSRPALASAGAVDAYMRTRRDDALGHLENGMWGAV